jgi:serine/threonine protein kinase
LKADNILLEKAGICKISDFGVSKRTDGTASHVMQGTAFWMAPEAIHPQNKGYNAKIDIWSLGCVVLEMWSGKRPWGGDEAITVMFKVRFLVCAAYLWYTHEFAAGIPEQATPAHTFRCGAI